MAPTTLFINPIFINFKISMVDFTGCILTSGIANPFGWVVLQIPTVCKSKETEILWNCNTCNRKILHSYLTKFKWIRIQKNCENGNKGYLFLDHHLRVDHELVQYKSQPSIHQLHIGWNLFYFDRFGKGHSMLGSWHPNFLLMRHYTHYSD